MLICLFLSIWTDRLAFALDHRAFKHFVNHKIRTISICSFCWTVPCALWRCLLSSERSGSLSKSISRHSDFAQRSVNSWSILASINLFVLISFLSFPQQTFCGLHWHIVNSKAPQYITVNNLPAVPKSCHQLSMTDIRSDRNVDAAFSSHPESKIVVMSIMTDEISGFDASRIELKSCVLIMRKNSNAFAVYTVAIRVWITHHDLFFFVVVIKIYSV